MTAFSPVGSSQVTVAPTPPSGASSPVVVNISLTGGNEGSFTFPDGVVSYQLKLRGSSSLQVAFVSGNTSSTYYTVPRGCFYQEGGLLTSALTIYFQSPDNGVLELLHWS